MVDSTNLPNVDINRIATDLNGKMDRDGVNALASVCIETYQNGASWYRVYSDGWCEQGSNTWLTQEPQTITLLKPFNSTDYVITTSNGDPNTDSAVVGSAVNSKSISSFVITSGYQSVFYANNLGWRACGYIN